MDLSGKTAIVIGASSGVGKAAARALLDAGARVTVVARGAAGLAALRSELGSRLSAVQADATDARTAESLLGERRPDFAVLTAEFVPEWGGRRRAPVGSAATPSSSIVETGTRCAP
jgi:NAD(P)-dependent dehydrogenase (short-subunit alcohol dehydrogenase family)